MDKKKYNKYVTGYIKDNIDRFEFKVPKKEGMKESIDNHCKKHYVIDGKPNRNAFILKAIKNQMRIDNGECYIVEK